MAKTPQLDAGTKVTIADIASASGVSPATVSLVLRDKPGISDDTRQRVLDTATSLGYIFKPSMKTQQDTVVSNIGLLVKSREGDAPFTNSFYGPVLAGIEQVCQRERINLSYATLEVDEDNNPLNAPVLLEGNQVDGLLIVGMYLGEAMTQTLQNNKTPVVLVDAYAPGEPYDSVVSDNFVGAYEALMYLADAGHKDIAIVGSLPDSYPSILERRHGYEAAIEELGIRPHFIEAPHWPMDNVAPMTVDYVQQHSEVTAIFCCNDDVAIAAMEALAKAGYNLPTGMSFVGFDNTQPSLFVTPKLTTMRIDQVGMGRMGAQLLINRIEYPEAGLTRTVIRPNLIERESVHRISG